MTEPTAYVPKDTQVRLFQEVSEMKLIPGETSIAIIARVEDVKAHPGQFGQVQITNIRIIWYIPRNPNINFSVGFKTLVNYYVTDTIQQGSGQSETLFIRCKDGPKTYEFIFSVAKSKQSMFRFFQRAVKTYEESPLLREQKLRSSLIKDGSLVLLPGEQVMLQLDGVANFSGDVAKLGTAIVTNYRFVWYSEIVSNFNVSIPLILLPLLKCSNSRRYGKCIYLKIISNGTNFMYGFTVQPQEKLVSFTKAFEKIRQAALRVPLLTLPCGIENEVIDAPPESVEEDLSLQDVDPSVLYLPADVIQEQNVGTIVYDKTLGLAIESLPEGASLTDKWKAASNTPLVDIDEL